MVGLETAARTVAKTIKSSKIVGAARFLVIIRSILSVSEGRKNLSEILIEALKLWLPTVFVRFMEAKGLRGVESFAAPGHLALVRFVLTGSRSSARHERRQRLQRQRRE
jgi:hypothetical protein